MIFVPILQYLSDIAISVRYRNICPISRYLSDWEKNKSSICEQFIDTSENKMVSEGQTQNKSFLRLRLYSQQRYVAVKWVEEWNCQHWRVTSSISYPFHVIGCDVSGRHRCHHAGVRCVFVLPARGKARLVVLVSLSIALRKMVI